MYNTEIRELNSKGMCWDCDACLAFFETAYKKKKDEEKKKRRSFWRGYQATAIHTVPFICWNFSIVSIYVFWVVFSQTLHKN